MYTYNVSLSGFVPSTGKRGYYNNIARLSSTPPPQKDTKQTKTSAATKQAKQKTCFWLCMNKQSPNCIILSVSGVHLQQINMKKCKKICDF